MLFNTKKNIIRQFILQRKFATLGIIIVGILSNLFTIIIPVSIGKYYELMFHFDAHRVVVLEFIPSIFWDTVPKFLFLFSSLVVIRFLFFFLYQYSIKKESELLVKEIKDYLFLHQLDIKYSIYQEKGIGKYLLRYTGDINSLKNLYLKGSIRVFIDSLMMIIAFYWLYMLHAKGALAILLLSFLSYFVIAIFNKKVEKYSLSKRNKNSGQLSYVSRTLNSIISIIIFNKKEVELKKYKKKSAAVQQTAVLYDKWFVLNKGFISFVQYAILSVVLYLFYLDTSPEQAAGSNLISFILLYITILPIIRRLFALETVYKLGNISLMKLNNIFAIEKENTEKGETLLVHNPRIELENVQFNDFEPINFYSKKMSLNYLQLPQGVAVLDLIIALTQIDNYYKGIIKINGQDIKLFSAKSLRNSIAILSPDIPLSGRTVYEVITAFRSKTIKQNVRNFFNKIQTNFDKATTLQLDDRIGENGSKISNIQYELLCFVRGLLYDRKILIVDTFPLLESCHKSYFLACLAQQEATVLLIK